MADSRLILAEPHPHWAEPWREWSSLLKISIILFFYIFISLFVAGKESFGLLGNPWPFVGQLLDFLEIVSSVDLPSLDETDIDGGSRTEKRAPHAHQTVVAETDLAVGISFNVVHGAALHTQVAPRAAVVVDFVKE